MIFLLLLLLLLLLLMAVAVAVAVAVAATVAAAAAAIAVSIAVAVAAAAAAAAVAVVGYQPVTIIIRFKCRSATINHIFSLVFGFFQLQGCLTVSALLEIVVGFIGGVGLLIRFIGPITIAPTIILIGMSLAPVVQHLCATQWWIAIM